MKVIILLLISISITQAIASSSPQKESTGELNYSENIFIITLDGFRWQEIFRGADPELINNEKFTHDIETMNLMYHAPDELGRRKKLLPFFWNVISEKGQLYGNRDLGSKVNSSNFFSLSYPGYNEVFADAPDLTITSNRKKRNPNVNVLEYLASKEEFKNEVAAFTSWDVFPYILNSGKGGVRINSGYDNDFVLSDVSPLLSELQETAVYDKKQTRHDELTYIAAKEYISKFTPRVVYIGFGETDEAAHEERYDLYLEKAAEADRMIGKLWHMVQSNAAYRDKTTFLITTDHGRGSKSSRWMDHGSFVRGSSQTWLAILGPHTSPLGEIKKGNQIYQKQLAQTIARIVGKDFKEENSVASAISLR